MAKQKKTKRTKLEDLSTSEQELTETEASKVKGGAVIDRLDFKGGAGKSALTKTLDKTTPLLIK